jgi:hypothetical protein
MGRFLGVGEPSVSGDHRTLLDDGQGKVEAVVHSPLCSDGNAQGELYTRAGGLNMHRKVVNALKIS